MSEKIFLTTNPDTKEATVTPEILVSFNPKDCKDAFYYTHINKVDMERVEKSSMANDKIYTLKDYIIKARFDDIEYYTNLFRKIECVAGVKFTMKPESNFFEELKSNTSQKAKESNPKSENYEISICRIADRILEKMYSKKIDVSFSEVAKENKAFIALGDYNSVICCEMIFEKEVCEKQILLQNSLAIALFTVLGFKGPSYQSLKEVKEYPSLFHTESEVFFKELKEIAFNPNKVGITLEEVPISPTYLDQMSLVKKFGPSGDISEQCRTMRADLAEHYPEYASLILGTYLVENTEL